jgi:hypothetical protein
MQKGKAWEGKRDRGTALRVRSCEPQCAQRITTRATRPECAPNAIVRAGCARNKHMQAEVRQECAWAGVRPKRAHASRSAPKARPCYLERTRNAPCVRSRKPECAWSAHRVRPGCARASRSAPRARLWKPELLEAN